MGIAANRPHRLEGNPSRRILIVEDQAHVPRGHSPILFAILARALHDLGWDVTVLTSRGWALAEASGPQPFTLRRLGRFAHVARRLAAATKLVPRPPRRTDHAAPDAVMTLAARRLRRRLGDADVIMTSQAADPNTVAALAGGGRWLLYQFWAPSASQRASGRFPRPVASVAERVQARRSVGDGLLRVVVNGAETRDRWIDVAAWLDPLQVPFAAGETPTPVDDAKRVVGVETATRVALLFGTLYPNKDHEVVWRAFEQLPDYQLVIAGHGAADGYRAWNEGRHRGRPPLLFDGYASEETKRLLYSAADLVVLSFRPGLHFDSGSLADTAAWGLPVVCSNQCQPGDAVERLSLGPLFESGNADSLVAAVPTAPATLDADVIDRARAEFSARRLAEAHIQALDRC